MRWYWVLLIVVACQGLFVLVWWLVTRNKGADINKELEDSTTKRLQEELEAERKKSEEIAAANSALTAKLTEIAAWYNKQTDRIEQEASDEFKAMAGDSSSIDAWLIDIISSSSANNSDPQDP